MVSLSRHIPSFFTLSLLMLLVLPALASANRILIIDDNSEAVNIVPYLDFIQDTDHSISFEQILRSPETQYEFKPVTGNTFISPDKTSRYWLRLKYKAAKDLSVKHEDRIFYVLNQAYTVLNLHAWFPQEDGTYRRMKAGLDEPHDEHAIDIQHYAFPMQVRAGESGTIYLLGDNSSTRISLSLPLYIFQENKFNQYWLLT